MHFRELTSFDLVAEQNRKPESQGISMMAPWYMLPAASSDRSRPIRRWPAQRTLFRKHAHIFSIVMHAFAYVYVYVCVSACMDVCM